MARTELEKEVLVDGLFVNKPSVVIHEWMEKCLTVENTQMSVLPTVFRLKNLSVILILCILWSEIEDLKLFYLGYRKFNNTMCKQQIYEFRLVGNDNSDTEDNMVTIMYRYQEAQQIWDPAGLYFVGGFDDANRFARKLLKLIRKDFKMELIEFVWNPDRLPWVMEYNLSAAMTL